MGAENIIGGNLSEKIFFSFSWLPIFPGRTMPFWQMMWTRWRLPAWFRRVTCSSWQDGCRRKLAMICFLEQNDLSGKQVYLFCSHSTGGLARSVETITEAAPDAMISDNIFDCYEDEASSSEDAIRGWVNRLGYSHLAETGGEFPSCGTKTNFRTVRRKYRCLWAKR